MPILKSLISRLVLSDDTFNKIEGRLNEQAKKTIQQSVKKEVKNEFSANVGEKISQFLPDELAKKDAINKLNAVEGKAQAFATSYFNTQGNTPLGATKPGTGIPFRLLREFSVMHWTSRACIGKRQNQISGLQWDIVAEDEDIDISGMTKDILAVKDFMKHIGGPGRKFREFLDIVIDDVLTLDALALYKVKSNIGDPLWYQTVDGATIKLRMNQDGSNPMPPDIAYEQWIRGKKTGEFTSDDMIYERMNARANTPYGLSPLESLIVTVQAALKSELSNLAILTEGNIPEGFIQAPPEWGPDEIKHFQEWFDGILAGSAKFQNRVRFIPGGKGSGYVPTKKPEDMRNAEFEEWLTIKTCALFGVTPQSIGVTFNVNKATAEDQSMLARNESVKPLAFFLQDLFTEIIQEGLQRPALAFKFLNLDTKDEKTQAEVDKIYLNSGVTDINEVRSRLGKEPLSDKPLHFIMTGTGPILVDDLGKTQAVPVATDVKEKPKPEEKEKEPEKPINELKRYQKKALNDLRKGRQFRKFYSDVVDPSTITSIEDEIKDCKEASEVKDVFSKYIGKEQDAFIDSAANLANELTAILKDDGHNKKNIKVERRAL
ncbi:MAG: phage portal protein [Candidatus Helarchaeota archaeon]